MHIVPAPLPLRLPVPSQPAAKQTEKSGRRRRGKLLPLFCCFFFEIYGSSCPRRRGRRRRWKGRTGAPERRGEREKRYELPGWLTWGLLPPLPPPGDRIFPLSLFLHVWPFSFFSWRRKLFSVYFRRQLLSWFSISIPSTLLRRSPVDSNEEGESASLLLLLVDRPRSSSLSCIFRGHSREAAEQEREEEEESFFFSLPPYSLLSFPCSSPENGRMGRKRKKRKKRPEREREKKVFLFSVFGER